MVAPARKQLGTLAHTFLARFFENEAAGTTTDAREGFFWLIAALATPGIFLPLWMYFRWAEVAAVSGFPALHATLLFDKTIYLGVTTASVALVCATAWHTLIVERRDALILGMLPVRRATITGAKLAALAGYIGLISLGMHAVAALLYGLGLSSIEHWSQLIRFTAGQFVAGIAMNLFVFSAVVGLQNLTIAILGPRKFARGSALLQVLVVGGGVAVLLLIPAMVAGTPALTASDATAVGPLLWLPPMWFLGLNEVISGTAFPVMTTLAARALLALGITVSIVLVAFPIASARTIAAAVEGSVAQRSRRLGALSALLIRAIGYTPERRGALQFMLAAFARTHQQRLILAVTVGTGIAALAPAALMFLAGTNLDAWSPHSFLNPPPTSLIAAPLLWNFVIVCGLRLAMAFPSEYPAAWLFAVAPTPMFVGRNAARSVMVLAGVVLPAALAAPVWYTVWPARLVTPVVVACVLGMLSVVDAALWGFVGIPCTKPLATSRTELPSRWPWLLVFVYLYGHTFPLWQIDLTLRPGWAVMLVPPVLIFIGVHVGSKSAARANALSGDPHGYLTLDLSVSAAQLRRSVPHA